MIDTHPKIAEKINQMVRRRSPAECFLMGCSMHDFAKEWVIGSILQRDPKINSAALKREIFLRFYGPDYAEDKRKKIADYFCSRSRRM